MSQTLNFNLFISGGVKGQIDFLNHISSTCLEEKFILYIKYMNIYCEVCECSIQKSGCGGHLTTTVDS